MQAQMQDTSALLAELERLRTENAKLQIKLNKRRLPSLTGPQLHEWLGDVGIATYTNWSAFDVLAHYDGRLYVRLRRAKVVNALATDPANQTEMAFFPMHHDMYDVLRENREPAPVGKAEPDLPISVYITHCTNADGEVEESQVIECWGNITREKFERRVPPGFVFVDRVRRPATTNVAMEDDIC